MSNKTNISQDASFSITGMSSGPGDDGESPGIGISVSETLELIADVEDTGDSQTAFKRH